MRGGGKCYNNKIGFLRLVCVPSSSGKSPLSFDISSFDAARVGLVTSDKDDDGSMEAAIKVEQEEREEEEEDGW